MNRRSFLASTVCLSATLALAADKSETQISTGAHKKRIKLGIATYSYWHFKTEKVPIETVIDKTAEVGVEGLDILHRQMDLPEKEPLTAAQPSPWPLTNPKHKFPPAPTKSASSLALPPILIGTSKPKKCQSKLSSIKPPRLASRVSTFFIAKWICPKKSL